MQYGYVKMWDNTKGFGFIVEDANQQGTFCVCIDTSGRCAYGPVWIVPPVAVKSPAIVWRVRC